MSRVKVYTTSYCPYCVRAKQLLSSNGIAFEEISLDGKDQELKDLKDRTGWRTVPQIFIDDELVGSFTELAEKASKGELTGL